MSAFYAKCQHCGTVYFHCMVGTTLYSGHACPEQPGLSPYAPAPEEPAPPLSDTKAEQ